MVNSQIVLRLLESGVDEVSGSSPLKLNFFYFYEKVHNNINAMTVIPVKIIMRKLSTVVNDKARSSAYPLNTISNKLWHMAATRTQL